MENIQEKTLIIGEQAVKVYRVEGGNSFLPQLVFLHGWRSESRVWWPVLKRFVKEGFNAVLIDLPGFGSSENPVRAFSMKDYADVVQEVITRLGLSNVVLIGHSFGGRTAIKLSIQNKSLFSRMVLVDAAGVRIHTRALGIKKVVAKVLKPVFEILPLQSLRSYIYRKMGAEDYISTPELKETFQKIVEEDLEPLLSRVEHKTLLVWGEKDTATTLAEAYIMNDKIPHSKLVILDGAGHYSFLDCPREFTEAVIAFAKNE